MTGGSYLSITGEDISEMLLLASQAKATKEAKKNARKNTRGETSRKGKKTQNQTSLVSDTPTCQNQNSPLPETPKFQDQTFSPLPDTPKCHILPSNNRGFAIRDKSFERRKRKIHEDLIDGEARIKKKEKVVETTPAIEELGSSERGTKYIPDWNIYNGDQIGFSAAQVENLLCNCFPPSERELMGNVSDESLRRTFWFKFSQALSCGVEMHSRFNKAKETKDALESEKMTIETKLKFKEAQLAKCMIMLKNKGAELEKAKTEIQLASQGYEERREAARKWKSEALRIKRRYETEDGNINEETENVVISAFLKSEQFKNCFLRLSQPTAKSCYLSVEQTLQEIDPNFQLPEKFQRVIEATSSSQEMPWVEGVEVNVNNLLQTFPSPESSKASSEEDYEEVDGEEE